MTADLFPLERSGNAVSLINSGALGGWGWGGGLAVDLLAGVELSRCLSRVLTCFFVGCAVQALVVTAASPAFHVCALFSSAAP